MATLVSVNFGKDGKGYAATSATSLSIGTGSKTLTTQKNRAYVVGSRIRVASAAAPTTKWLEGVVTSYSGTTLVFTADKTAGSGSAADWNLSIAGEPGAQGASGASNFADIGGVPADNYQLALALSTKLNQNGAAADANPLGANLAAAFANKLSIYGTAADVNPAGSGIAAALAGKLGTSAQAADVNPAGTAIATALSGKLGTSGTAADVNPAGSGIAAALAAKVPTSRNITASGLATGGGNMSADRTITVPGASQAEAEAGVNNTTAMTPLRTAQAIAALAPGGVGGSIDTAHGLWVDPVNGDDGNSGAFGDAFETLAAAFAASDASSVIYLLPGTHAAPNMALIGQKIVLMAGATLSATRAATPPFATVNIGSFNATTIRFTLDAIEYAVDIRNADLTGASSGGGVAYCDFAGDTLAEIRDAVLGAVATGIGTTPTAIANSFVGDPGVPAADFTVSGTTISSSVFTQGSQFSSANGSSTLTLSDNTVAGWNVGHVFTGTGTIAGPGHIIFDASAHRPGESYIAERASSLAAVTDGDVLSFAVGSIEIRPCDPALGQTRAFTQDGGELNVKTDRRCGMNLQHGPGSGILAWWENGLMRFECGSIDADLYVVWSQATDAAKGDLYMVAHSTIQNTDHSFADGCIIYCEGTAAAAACWLTAPVIRGAGLGLCYSQVPGVNKLYFTAQKAYGQLYGGENSLLYLAATKWQKASAGVLINTNGQVFIAVDHLDDGAFGGTLGIIQTPAGQSSIKIGYYKATPGSFGLLIAGLGQTTIRDSELDFTAISGGGPISVASNSTVNLRNTAMLAHATRKDVSVGSGCTANIAGGYGSGTGGNYRTDGAGTVNFLTPV